MSVESTGIPAQDTDVRIEGAPGATLNITGVSKAASAVCLCTSPPVVGTDVEFGAIAGMPEIRGRIGTVTAVADGVSFTVNIDTTEFATAGTTGTASVKTWLSIANVKTFNGFDGQNSEIDKSHLRSGAKEFAPGLEDFGNISMTVDNDDDDPGQAACRQSKSKRQIKAFQIVLPNNNKRSFKGYVRQFTENAAVDGMYGGNLQVRITGVVTYFNAV